MKKKISKLLVGLMAGAVLIMGTISPALAQTATPTPPASSSHVSEPWYSQSLGQWYSKVYDNQNPQEIFGERYTAAQVQWVFYGFLSMFVRGILGGCTADSVNAFMNGNLGGLVCGSGVSTLVRPSVLSTKQNTNLLTEIFADRPLSGVTYFKNIGRNLHIIPQVQAQSAGLGYGALDPIRPLWGATRDISYAFFAIIILILAFMIMFRVKISPQVVISVQSALPKIVVALIIVTFSYAIAGFLIDLMYVVIGLLSIIFANIFSSWNTVHGALGGGALIFSHGVTSTDVFTVLTRGFGDSGVFGFLVYYFAMFLASFLIILIVIVNNAFASAATLGVVGGSVAIVGGVVFASIGVLAAVIFTVAMFVMLLVLSVRVVVALIRAFAYILFLTILLPLMATFGIVAPGVGFGMWLKLFVANLAVFPIVGSLFLLSFIFLQEGASYALNNYVTFSTTAGSAALTATGTSSNIPGWPPLVGITPGGTALAFLIASFFIISLAPKAAEVAGALINGKGNFGNAIGEAMGPISQPASAYLEGHSRAHPGTVVGALAGAAGGALKGR